MVSPKLAPGFFHRLFHHPVRLHLRRSTIELLVAFVVLAGLNVKLPRDNPAKAPPGFVLVPAPTTTAVPKRAPTTIPRITTATMPATVPPTDTTTSAPSTAPTTTTSLILPVGTTTVPGSSTSAPPHT